MLREMHAFVALGANLPGPTGQTPLETCKAAVETLTLRVGGLIAVSSWYETAPVPESDQPWFVNGVARLATDMRPRSILERLHDIEKEAGRTRRQQWEARILDLDLLAVDDLIVDEPNGLILPHPRLAERSFVLRPMADIAPDWRHPLNGQTVQEMLDALPAPSKTKILR